MEFRVAHEDEEEACWALENSVWRSFHTEAEGGIAMAYDPALHVVAIDDDGTLIATGDASPIEWDGDPTHLPAGGWYEVITSEIERRELGLPSPTRFACALGITVTPGHEGRGIGLGVLQALRAAAKSAGYEALVAPVRPTERQRMPQLSLAEYAQIRLPDGRHFDPWVRVHERAGGEIIGSCASSVVFRGSREQWERWSGLKLPASGMVLIDRANWFLEIEGDEGCLQEHSLWLLHALT